MIYQPKHYTIKELVSPQFYDTWGERALWFLDPGTLYDIDTIREYVGSSITINDWSWGGRFRFSGLRQEGDEYYNPTSAHAFGKAYDLKARDVDSKELKDIVIEMKKGQHLKYITRMEIETPGWTHVDSFNTKPNQSDVNLYLFRP